jgi:single-strand DNA-binding protein
VFFLFLILAEKSENEHHRRSFAFLRGCIDYFNARRAKIMNKTLFVGRTTKDTELEKTANDQSYARFTLAVNRERKNSKGSYDTDYVPCKIWGTQAENFVNWIKKGYLIELEASYRSGSYQDSNGVTRYTHEFEVSRFKNLTPKTNANLAGTEDNAYSAATEPTDNTYAHPQVQSTPKTVPTNYSDPFGGQAELHLTPNELPF